MNQTPAVKKLYNDGLIKNGGHALDLGCGKGMDVLSLANLDFEVDAVDVDATALDNLKSELAKDEYKDSKVNIVNQKIEDFKVKEGVYDCIIAINSLPFIDSKEKVIEIIKNIVLGLKEDGCMYITLFGKKDAWTDKENMSFFEYGEIKNVLDSLGDVSFYHSTIEEGYGKTIKGDIKYWNIFRFIYIKK